MGADALPYLAFVVPNEMDAPLARQQEHEAADRAVLERVQQEQRAAAEAKQQRQEEERRQEEARQRLRMAEQQRKRDGLTRLVLSTAAGVRRRGYDRVIDLVCRR